MPQLVARRQLWTAGQGQAVLVPGGHLIAVGQAQRGKVTTAARGRVQQAVGAEEWAVAVVVVKAQLVRVAVQHRRVEMGEPGGQTTTEREAMLLTPQAAAGALFLVGMGLSKTQPQAQEHQAFQATATITTAGRGLMALTDLLTGAAQKR